MITLSLLSNSAVASSGASLNISDNNHLVNMIGAIAPIISMIRANNPNLVDRITPTKRARYKHPKLSMEEHCRCGHTPHDPMCEACIRSRLTAKLAYRMDDDDVVKGADKGYVMGVDYIGPYVPDVDGNIWAFVGVEVAHTNYGFVQLSSDKESSTATTALQQSRIELEMLSWTNFV